MSSERVLCVDDDAQVRALIARVVMTAGYECVGVGTVDPRGLKGEEIPLGGRIVAVADVFDALSSDRPYRPRLSIDEARASVLEGSECAFDPAVVEAFARSLDLVAA